MASENLILIGFSFTGKSAVGREVARRLGWEFADTDAMVEAQAGKAIPDIFSQEGEEAFRRGERQALERACRGRNRVIAVGGGAVLRPENRNLMMEKGVVVCLEARPETIYHRLQEEALHNPSPVLRPLLASENPLERISSLKEFRQAFYSFADWTVHTDDLTLGEVCGEVLQGLDYGRRRFGKGSSPSIYPSATASEAQVPYCQGYGAAAVVTTATASYPIFVGYGLLEQLGEKMAGAGLKGKVYIISDDVVFPLYGKGVEDVLAGAGFSVSSFAVPAGEGSKTLGMASRLYDWLVREKAERGQAIVALGGGMVGDLAGFVASTFLRGLPLVHVPTTLLAMVDASIGGKVAVNHRRAKNIMGAFYQPRLVVADTATLPSLPRRELPSGWAEVIKHGLILDASLFSFLEDRAEVLLALEESAVVEAVRRSAAIKAGVVSRDEREETGLRTLLNYGHTLGHALEAVGGYQTYLHGEAVAIGMTAAAHISHRLGLLSQEGLERHNSLLSRFGLPTSFSGASVRAVFKAMELDKKVQQGRVRWVLLEDIGKAVIREDVPLSLVKEVVQGLAQ